MRINRIIQLCSVCLAGAVLILGCENPTGNDGDDGDGENNGDGTESDLVISTDGAADVAKHTATLNGTLEEMGALESVDVRFQYGEAEITDWDDESQVTSTATQTLTSAGTFDGEFATEIAGLAGDTDGPTDYEFRAVAYDADGTAIAGDVSSFTTVGLGHTDRVLALAVDQGNDVLYTASEDQTVHKIDISGTDPQRVWVYKGHSDDVTALAIHPSTGNLYTGSEDREIHIVDPTGQSPTQENVYTPRPYGGINDLVFDGNILYVAAGAIDRVDTSGNSLSADWDDHYAPSSDNNVPQALAVDPNNDHIIYSSGGDGVDDGGELFRIDTSGTTPSSTELTMAKDLELERIRALATADEDGNTVLYTGADDASLRKFSDVVAGTSGTEEWFKEFGSVNNITSIAQRGPDQVVVGSYGSVVDAGQVRNTDASNGTRQWLYSDHENYVYAVAVDSDGDVYSASLDGEVHKTDGESGEQVWRYR